MGHEVKALDMFAGPGGWSQACRRLGIVEHGIELDPSARATREQAGHTTVHNDVTTYVANKGYDILIASPPCQTFSRAGKGSGRQAITVITDALSEQVLPSSDDLSTATGDARTALVMEPIRWVKKWWPPLVALEQVPTVLPVWEAYAEWMQGFGYKTWVGYLHAEQYGVPQTRKRAFLLASMWEQPFSPEPSHSRYYSHNPAQMDIGVEPWVTMADALGWGLGNRPSYTVTGGGTAAGGAEPFGNQARQAMQERVAFTELGQQQVLKAEVADVKEWVFKRPATTVAGRGLIADPGTNANRYNGATKSRNDGIRITTTDAGVLQGFPADYPWQGTQTQQFQQIGNAVPPPLAQAVLAELTKGKQ